VFDVLLTIRFSDLITKMLCHLPTQPWSFRLSSLLQCSKENNEDSMYVRYTLYSLHCHQWQP